MAGLLPELLGALQQSQVLLIAALMIARTMPMVWLTPFLGGQLIPLEIKMGIGVLLVVLIYPGAQGVLDGPLPLAPAPFMALMLKEAFIGFSIGFVNGHIYYAMNMSGRIVDTVRATSMSEVQDPHSKKRVTPTGDLYTQLFLVIFMVGGGHHIFLTAYAFSFQTLPVDQMLSWGDPALNPFFDFMMKLTAEILVIAVILAAPVMAATFISDVVFGILNRVAPQLNAYFMSMPVKALGGVIMLFIAFEAITLRLNDFVVWILRELEIMLELLFV